MTRILAPHKEQDGWVYVRVRRSKTYEDGTIAGRFPMCDEYGELPSTMAGWFEYADHHPACRVLTSRKVEEAVETLEYLRLCAEEGLTALWQGRTQRWLVWCDGTEAKASVRTLREAYFRYKAAADATE